MSASLIPFQFDTQSVRVMNNSGEPWFVAKDVCDVLGIIKHRDAISRLDDDERGSVLVDTLGGKQSTGTISESGLYALVLTSRKPEARRFRKFITSEVIPSIRKTGGYGEVSTLSQDVRSAIGGIVKGVIHKELMEMLPQMIEREAAARGVLIRRGVTAKTIWDNHQLPKRIKGSTTWLGNRLSEMGCLTSKAERGGQAVRIFDPDKAQICMKNGLGISAQRYADERKGQRKLRLIDGGL